MLPPPSKRRRTQYRAADFIDDEAARSDGTESEDGSGEDGGRFIDPRGDAEFDNADTVPHRVLMEDMAPVDLHHVARELQERYRLMSVRVPDDESDGAKRSALFDWMHQDRLDEVVHTATERDNLIWKIRVTCGHEWDVVRTISKICESSAQRGGLLSASACPSVRGAVYIEANSESEVRRLMRTVAFIRRSQSPVQVPLDDYVHLMTVPSDSESRLAAGTWVRFTGKGSYTGDLAWISDFDDDTHTYIVWLVPRIVRPASGNSVAGNEAATGTRAKPHRLPQGLLLHEDLQRTAAPPSSESCHDDEDANVSSGSVRSSPSPDRELKYGNCVFHFGFLVLDHIRSRNLSDDRIGATYAELNMFQQSPLYMAGSDIEDDSESSFFSQSVDRLRANIARTCMLDIGDKVRILPGPTSGTWTGFVGDIVDLLAGSKVVVEFVDVEFSTREVFAWTDVMLDHHVGGLVDVCSGPCAGLSGWITEVDWTKRNAT
ncbi:hypothetical protein B0H10DRAFT_1961840, partial [Mycena sp. CBHHK59/15]